MGQPNTCIAPHCEPGSFVKCRGTETLVCNSEGNNIDTLECSSGCVQGAATCSPCMPGEFSCGDKVVQQCGSDGVFHPSESCDVACASTPAPHCAYLEPKYLPDICDTPATVESRMFTNASTFDTNLDVNCNGGIIAQNAGPTICVVRAKTIAITAGATLKVTGPRAIAFVGDTSVDVAGTLDVSGDTEVDGPGGGVGNPGTGGMGDGVGAGGAGFATAGGAGGTTTVDGGAANGGPATTNPAALSALVGGSRGGGGGGGAGGAATLIACRGLMSVEGTVTAGGGGAAGAGVVMVGMTTKGSPGYGGGSGGNVVLQGMDVAVTGAVFANGGGGGGGRSASFSGPSGIPASDGTSDGGPGSLANAGMGNGGDGGGHAPPRNGKAAVSGGTPGGGGGSVGFLQTYTPDSVTPTLTPNMASPALQPNLHVKTR